MTMRHAQVADNTTTHPPRPQPVRGNTTPSTEKRRRRGAEAAYEDLQFEIKEQVQVGALTARGIATACDVPPLVPCTFVIDHPPAALVEVPRVGTYRSSFSLRLKQITARGRWAAMPPTTSRCMLQCSSETISFPIRSERRHTSGLSHRRCANAGRSIFGGTNPLGFLALQRHILNRAEYENGGVSHHRCYALIGVVVAVVIVHTLQACDWIHKKRTL